MKTALHLCSGFTRSFAPCNFAALSELEQDARERYSFRRDFDVLRANSRASLLLRAIKFELGVLYLTYKRLHARILRSVRYKIIEALNFFPHAKKTRSTQGRAGNFAAVSFHQAWVTKKKKHYIKAWESTSTVLLPNLTSIFHTSTYRHSKYPANDKGAAIQKRVKF